MSGQDHSFTKKGNRDEIVTIYVPPSKHVDELAGTVSTRPAIFFPIIKRAIVLPAHSIGETFIDHVEDIDSDGQKVRLIRREDTYVCEYQGRGVAQVTRVSHVPVENYPRVDLEKKTSLLQLCCRVSLSQR